MNNRKFEILTLSDCVGCESTYSNLGDPVSIIVGGVAVIQGLFPNIFGGGRRELTSADWTQMFPGAGAWTVRLRNYLARTIHYDSDLGNIEEFTRNFVYENMGSLAGANFTEKYSNFLAIIQQEKFSGGTSPIGNIPGYVAGINYQQLIPYALGGLVLVFLLKRKKGGR